jgi:adenosylcobinamide kinase / adenosylcobinamide-phosphate guanylyltransferase
VLTFITGPVRAGKSALAERLARGSAHPVVYCATAARDDTDPEWIVRIERHRAQRPAEWTLLETAGPHGVDLVETICRAKPETLVVIESLGTWVSDILGRRAETLGTDVVALSNDVESESKRLLDAILACRADLLIVSEEVGWGVVPAFAAGRVFRDVMGRANQRLCAKADRAYLVVSGVAFDLKTALPFDSL